MDFTAQYKAEIERNIVDTIIMGLEKSEIQEPMLPEVADFVLTKLDQVQNHSQLLEFLVLLSDKWQIFKNILDIETGRAKTDMEKKAANDVLLLANQGNIEEAIRLAKSITQPQI